MHFGKNPRKYRRNILYCIDMKKIGSVHYYLREGGGRFSDANSRRGGL